MCALSCFFFHLKILTVWSDHNSWLWISNEIIVSYFEINFHIATDEYEMNEEKDLEKKNTQLNTFFHVKIVKWFRRWNRWQNARRRIFWSQVPDERFHFFFRSVINWYLQPLTNAHRIGRDESKMHIENCPRPPTTKWPTNCWSTHTANSSICSKQVYSNWFFSSIKRKLQQNVFLFSISI